MTDKPEKRKANLCRACGDTGHVYVRGHEAVRGRKIIYFGASKYEAEPFWIGADGKPKIPVECRCTRGTPYAHDPSMPGDHKCARCGGCGWHVWPEDTPIPDDVEVLGQTFSGRDRVLCTCKPAPRDWAVEVIPTEPMSQDNWEEF